MKLIIVPVDLSRNAKEATRYAANIAAYAGARLLIVHYHHLLHKVVSHTSGKTVSNIDADRWIQKRIHKIALKHPGLEVDYKIIKDNIIAHLKHLVEDSRADLVIMGCQGENENPTTFLGSTSGSLVKTTEIPALLVPPRYKFVRIERVIFAAKDTYVRFMGALEPIILINQIFKPNVQLLHIGQNTSSIPEQSFSILQVVHDITRYGSDNFNESIREYLTQHSADLLCVIRRKRGILEKLLGPAGTPSSKFNVEIPVLVLIGEG